MKWAVKNCFNPADQSTVKGCSLISQAQVRAQIDRVTSYPQAERERLYRKYFSTPSSTVRYLCERHGFDQKRILDATCHYGYYLIYFGANSEGLDGNLNYLRFAQEMGLKAQIANIEEPLPAFDAPFDGIVFSGTLEEILSPHVLLMRFRRILNPDGLLCLRVPVVPPAWADKLMRLCGLKPGYDAAAHLYFFTPKLLKLMVERAGYDVIETVSTGVWANALLRPLHRLLLPMTPVVTLMCRPRANFQYPPVREMKFLPEWAKDTAPFHQDYDGGSSA